VFSRLLRKTRKADGELGQAVAEFALVIPIFLLLVFAIVDFGMGLYSWITVTNAAREGARLGTVGADEASITARVRDTVGNLDNADLTVDVTNCVSGCLTTGDPGESVSVHVDYQYHLITPISSILNLVSGGTIGPTLTFDATSEMRLE
jgi:Flp pilus assembly protein TadG